MENEPQETRLSQIQRSNALHQVTPLSKYLAMFPFIILPFLGGYVGYTYAPEKVVEVEREVIKEVEVARVVEVTEVSKIMSTITNVELDSPVSLGESVSVTWDFEPGAKHDLDNVYVKFQLENLNGVVLSERLKGAGSSDVYKQGRADIYIPTLCSEVPTEGCINDNVFVEGAAYVVKVVEQSCADGETLPGYCEFYNTTLLETDAVYSNEFILK